MTPNRAGEAAAGDGVHELSRGQPVYVEQPVMHFVKGYEVGPGFTIFQGGQGVQGDDGETAAVVEVSESANQYRGSSLYILDYT